MNVAIIGCGFIGDKRARALAGCRLVACADVIVERAAAFARSRPGVEAVHDWRSAVERPDVDIVLAATTHDALAEVTLAAVQAGKHVLVEKPAARNPSELRPVIESVRGKNIIVRVGFNHRYHPSFIRAGEIAASGQLGDLMFIRGRYGHGGRIGYEKEWRAVKELSGGGELIDQGVHLIDLARTFLGDFTEVHGYAHTYFWDMDVEDNGFMLLKTPKQQVAFLHTSWTEWKNTFSFEIFGRHGKLDISGLGGSYGVERLAYYKMLPRMGPPETVIWEYPMPDRSWDVEFEEFVEDIRLGRQPAAGLNDALAALEIVERIYEESRL
ncbi:MAG: Gfo/Idh/MocA family oxidoreductase [Syntrophobacteraceae bacterium]|jgi:predicted dehydrogenase